MPYSDEFCPIHGFTLIHDRKSGFDLCPHCESEKSGKNIPVGATICAHGVEPYDCRVCFPIDQPIHKKECTARTGGECNCGLSWKVPSYEDGSRALRRTR